MTLSSAEVDEAVARSVLARDAWGLSAPAERIDAVRAIAAGLREARDELVDVIETELGQPRAFTEAVHVDGPIDGLALLAADAEQIQWRRAIDGATVEQVPVGVVAALTPWNYPLHQVVAKVGAALLAGCTVVLKPSELAPLTADVFARVAREHLPAGVLEVVHGDGVVGAELVQHPDIDHVSFTGSERVGRLVAAAAGSAGHKVTLELGGKSAAVVLDDLGDAALTRVVRLVVAEAVMNAGQTCNALTRLVVPRDRVDFVTAAAERAASAYKAGERLGRLRTDAAVARVDALVRSAVEDGARLVVGGHANGQFFEATVLADVTTEHDVARTEIFGPVLCVMSHDGDDDARRIADDTGFGLSIAVWATDPERSERWASGLRVGQVRINAAAWDSRLPFGGFGRSGFGREWGIEGIEEFLTTRVIARP